MSRHIEAMVVWMSEQPLDTSRAYWIKHGTRYLHVNVEDVCWKMDLEKLEKTSVDQLRLNDIACLQLTTHRSLTFDPYHENRGTGAFILIDFMSNNTVGAGMIQDSFETTSHNIVLTQSSQLSTSEREQRLRQKGVCLSLYGERALSLAYALERKLFDMGQLPFVLKEGNAETCQTLIDAGLLVLRVNENEEAINSDDLSLDPNEAIEQLLHKLDNALK
ncbi:MAG: hypothetical protein CMK59_06340 [Proteobacteria bacterium]|nr:hypothetical protein [Pseudomonadota bacterium]